MLDIMRNSVPNQTQNFLSRWYLRPEMWFGSPSAPRQSPEAFHSPLFRTSIRPPPDLDRRKQYLYFCFPNYPRKLSVTFLRKLKILDQAGTERLDHGQRDTNSSSSVYQRFIRFKLGARVLPWLD